MIEMIREKKGTLVDVRTREEFMGGHVAGSFNIPIQELTTRLDELKVMKQPLILYCASGGRSAQAAQYLKQLGYECLNAGSWMDVNFIQNQNK
ncbi:MAG: rhodanese-like domain-containing protein [Bacteroidota bacterium]|jgi:rhodanese-related sulfurtransferase